MSFWNIYLPGLAVILTLTSLLWLLSLPLKNASIVDIFWGTGFVVAAWVYLSLSPTPPGPRQWLLAGLVSLWGLRLSLHILLRNHGKPEDFRYQKWRQEAGPSWTWLSLPRVFWMQGLLLWIISLPLAAAQQPSSSAGLGPLDVLGALVWLLGFFFEATGDWQLARFKANPANRGKVMDSGVWRFTRHPNYFGDAAQWWGFFLLAAGAGAWWTFLSPLLMTFLLMRVSGVALLEKTLQARPGYAEYTRRTNAFFPWLPKK